MVTPSNRTLTSWIKSLVILRNTCAHNARIYNKPFNITPEIIKADKVIPQPSHSGLYELVLAMKYLRPDNSSWEDFSAGLKQLIREYTSYIKLSAINFPNDWENHLKLLHKRYPITYTKNDRACYTSAASAKSRTFMGFPAIFRESLFSAFTSLL